jgi:hypothetical protein
VTSATRSRIAAAMWVLSVPFALLGILGLAGWQSAERVWPALPFVLRGAGFGALIVLLLGAVIVTVRAGVRRSADMGMARLFHAGVALSVALAVAVAGIPRGGTGTSADARRALASMQHDPPAPAAAAAPQPEALRALAESDREAPRDRWDPDYVAGQLGTDPGALLEWVRDNTFWIPYRGILRGAAGVLMDRQGNSLDRSILLATLLGNAGHVTRLAHRQLTTEQARARLSQVVPTVDAIPVKPPERDLASLAVEYSLDDSALAPTLRAQAQTMKPLLADLDRRVTDQSARLLAAVGPQVSRTAATYDRVVDALADYWWVQLQEQGAWRDLDPALSADEPPSSAAADQSIEMPKLDASLWHDVEVRVVVERWADGAITEQPVLRRVLRPADVMGKSVVLQFWPTSLAQQSGLTARGGEPLARAALEQHEWAAALVIDRNVVAQALISDGYAPQNTTSGNPFGAMGGNVGGVFARQRDGAAAKGARQELSAAWIEYEVHVPGEARRTTRSVVFDLIGAGGRAMQPAPMPALGAQQRLARSLSLTMRTEILPLGCQLAPEFLMHLSAQSILANADVLRAVSRPEATPADFSRMLEGTAASVSSLYTLALMRLEWSPVGDRVFINEPNVLTRHRYPVSSGDGLAIRDAIDIVANKVDVDLGADDPFGIRLRQGVFDTNAEALLPMPGRSLGNAATAFDGSPAGWRTLTANATSTEGLQLPSDALVSLAADLRAGHTVVAPTSPVATSADPFVGWWRVDPRSGTTLGVGANGWGQAMTENAIHNHLLAEMAQTFVFDYAFCQAIPLALNQTNMLLQRMEFIPTALLALPQVHDPTAIWQENAKGCLIGAMISTGITATLPLVMMTLRYRQMARIRNGFCFVAGTLVATTLGPRPIERVRPGDLVISWDERTGEQAVKPVQRVFVTLARPVLTIRFAAGDGETHLVATADHPFWVEGRGWVAAKDLQCGDRVVSRDSTALETISVTPRPRQTVYNLEVADFHTYFAGAAGARVHNACSKAAFNDVWIKRSLYQDLQRQAGQSNFKKFVAALDKGLVGPVNEVGVKKLSYSVRGYDYELKIGNSAARLLGKIDGNGILIFEEYLAAGLHK